VLSVKEIPRRFHLRSDAASPRIDNRLDFQPG